MVSGEEQIDLCRKTCFAASALGYIVLSEEDRATGMIRYTFQSTIGNKVAGEFHPIKKDALTSACINFNEQVKPHGQ